MNEIAPLSGTSAAAQDLSYARPLVHGEPFEVADGVFVIADHRQPLVPNVGFVVGERAALVIDTGAGARNGAFVLAQARRLAGKRPLYLAITQFDPGHGFGVQAFRGEATILYSNLQAERLRRFGTSYAETFRADMGPEVAAELTDLEFVDADLVHFGRLEIDLGGIRATLEQWGPAHTLDDQTVLVDDRVLFGGDLFQTRMFAILPYFAPFDSHFDSDRWIGALDRLLTAPVSVVVPGHGEVTDLEQVRAVREYLVWARDRTLELRASGSSLGDVQAGLQQEGVARWTSWDEPRWIRTAVRAFWDEADARDSA